MAGSGELDLWRLFEKTLARTLADLPEISYLIVSTSGPDPEHERYVQFAIYEDDLRGETAADVFLPDDAKLSPENRAELGRLGFNAPTVEAERAAGQYDTDEGSVNWFRDYPKPPDFAAAAALAVQTLRTVHGVGSPVELRYISFREGGEAIRLPRLGIGPEDADVDGDASVEALVATGRCFAALELLRSSSGGGGIAVREARILRDFELAEDALERVTTEGWQTDPAAVACAATTRVGVGDVEGAAELLDAIPASASWDDPVAVDDLFEAFVGVARHRWFEGETEAATGLLERCSVICTDAGQPVIAARADLVGAELLAGSDPAASLATMWDARAVFDEHGAERDRAGVDLDLGNALFDLRRFDEAVQAYQDALTVFDLTDPDSAAAVRVGYGQALRAIDREGEAVAELQSALAYYEATGNTARVADCLFIVGNALADLIELAYATECISLARAIYDRMDAEQTVVRCDSALAGLAAEMGRFDEALAGYESSRGANLHLGQDVDAAVDDMNLGDVLRHLGRLDEATQRATDAVTVLRAQGPRDFAARAEANLAWIRATAGDDAGALAHLELARSEGCPGLDLVEAVVHRHGGRPQQATESARRGLALLASEDGSVPQADLLEELGRALADTGDAQEAAPFLRAARSVFRRYGLAFRVDGCDELLATLGEGGDLILRDVADLMGLRPDQVEVIPNGFRWWGPRLAQEVHLGKDRDAGFRLGASTDVLEPIGADADPLGDLAMRNQAGIGAYVRDPDTRMLRLVSSVSLADRQDPALNLFAVCAVAQAARAEDDADNLTFAYRSPVAAATPPESVQRAQLSLTTGTLAFSPGNLAETARRHDFSDQFDGNLARFIALADDCYDLDIGAEGIDSTVACLRVDTAMGALGRGATLEVVSPGMRTAVEAAHLAHECNLVVNAADATPLAVGAWSGAGGVIRWTAFLPAAAFMRLGPGGCDSLAITFVTSALDLVQAVHDIVPSAGRSEADNPNEVVWGCPDGDEPVFILRRRAEDLATLWSALSSARTWGDLRRSLPPRLFRETVDACWGDDDELDDDEIFSYDSVGVIADGDFPGIPTQEVLAWMPADIREQYGDVGMSMVSGPLLSFRSDDAAAIAAALEEQGFATTRDDDLVASACAWLWS